MCIWKIRVNSWLKTDAKTDVTWRRKLLIYLLNSKHTRSSLNDLDLPYFFFIELLLKDIEGQNFTVKCLMHLNICLYFRSNLKKSCKQIFFFSKINKILTKKLNRKAANTFNYKAYILMLKCGCRTENNYSCVVMQVKKKFCVCHTRFFFFSRLMMSI